ncbi:small-conductance mechanosensitive channel [Curtobacterium sp. PhB130]|uniref:mechanosensitive ion channel family protein n=1 Tax=unclassified Curtobacterium TaxID=257496 RepID=UPI000FB2635E|nr:MULTISPECIES: mechanosensitive ion channel family protein [unclassified Curtobacterium]ROS75180.1 small-conductance mechanosensitive channel [Curtobacterium sp. PhB130]TCK63805.1 small-conductance mechanosensitive channel [Curtobacterium sp. PhB136]
MQDFLNQLLKESSFNVWDVVLAAVVVVLGWMASIWARKGTRKLLERWSGLGAESTNLLSRLVRYGILLLTVGIVLSVLGAPLQPVLAAVIIVVTVAVLALRGIAANFGAGLVIQARRPVRMGDTIEVDGRQGRIIELTGRTVLLLTSEGDTIRVPNALLLQRPLVNSTESGAVRNEIWVRVTSDMSANAVLQTIHDAVLSIPHRNERLPETLLETAGPRQVDASVRFWTSYVDREAARSAAVNAVLDALNSQQPDAWVSSHRPHAVDWVRPIPPISPRPGEAPDQ